MNLELLTKAIERVMATKYGKTVTVRIEDVTGKGKADKSSECSEADQGSKSGRPTRYRPRAKNPRDEGNQSAE